MPDVWAFLDLVHVEVPFGSFWLILASCLSLVDRFLLDQSKDRREDFKMRSALG